MHPDDGRGNGRTDEPTWAAFLLGIGAGIGVVLVVLNLRGLWRTRRGRRSSMAIASEAERWLETRRDDEQRDP
jgi:hypothetical protein